MTEAQPTPPPVTDTAGVNIPVPDGAGSVSFEIYTGDRKYNYGTPVKASDVITLNWFGNSVLLSIAPGGTGIGGGAVPGQKWSGEQPPSVSMQWG